MQSACESVFDSVPLEKSSLLHRQTTDWGVVAVVDLEGAERWGTRIRTVGLDAVQLLWSGRAVTDGGDVVLEGVSVRDARGRD